MALSAWHPCLVFQELVQVHNCFHGPLMLVLSMLASSWAVHTPTAPCFSRTHHEYDTVQLDWHDPTLSTASMRPNGDCTAMYMPRMTLSRVRSEGRMDFCAGGCPAADILAMFPQIYPNMYRRVCQSHRAHHGAHPMLVVCMDGSPLKARVP